MFVIVYNGNVILGPMNWNARRFSEIIEEDCEVSVVLNLKNDEDNIITVNDQIKIYPVTSEANPEYNPRTQMLNGPFWTYTDTHAVSSMQVQSLPLEAIQNFLRQDAGAERWKKQYSGVKVTINGTEYSFATDPVTRTTFHQYLTSGIASVNWKIDQVTWITLTAENISAIFTAIVNHIQTAFEWEAAKNTEITAATLETINSIVITETNAS